MMSLPVPVMDSTPLDSTTPPPDSTTTPQHHHHHPLNSTTPSTAPPPLDSTSPVNKRAVRILLECFLVILKLAPNIFHKQGHSSRMHTARVLTVSPSMLCAGGVPGLGGCAQGEFLVRGEGGAWSGRCLVQEGCLVRGGGIPSCTEADPP